MEEEGIVINIKDDEVTVLCDKKSGCGGGCSSCKGSCGSEKLIIKAKSKGKLNVGDKVKVELDNSDYKKLLFFGYGVSIIFTIIGLVVGEFVFKNELVAILFAMVFMVISFKISKKFMKKEISYSIK